MTTKTQSIKAFLIARTLTDLADMYHAGMEVQVNVAQDDGEKIQGEYRGKSWIGYTDGVQTWKPFRIPYKANTEPEYVDTEMKWDLEQHAQAIGMTGWDWQLKLSRWVAFDFDAIVGHSDKHLAKLTKEELDAVVEAASSLDYVTIRKSTSGHGLHLYVELEGVETANHNEHAALARAILGKMSLDCSFDFVSNVDICGGNMWVWRRNMQPQSLLLIKQGLPLTDIPPNWKEHIKVITKKRKRIQSSSLRDDASKTEFDLLMGKASKVVLDKEHKKLLEYLERNNLFHYFDKDNHMLVTHTRHLQRAAEELSLAGIFKTDSLGTDLDKQNCFATPLKNGIWIVRRFSLGCKEHESWEQDSRGWTRCFLNKPLAFEESARIYGAVEDTKGNHNFSSAQEATLSLAQLGIDLNIDPRLNNNHAIVRKHKDGQRIVVTIDVDGKDLQIADTKGWHLEKKGDQITKIFSPRVEDNVEGKGELFDDVVRYVIDEHGVEIGWFLRNEENGIWIDVANANIKYYLKHCGMKAAEADETLGASIERPWIQVVEPFQEEYIGERRWNRTGAKFKYQPTLEYKETPTWDMILGHIGTDLDVAVSTHPWCKANGIFSGKDYLTVWIASLFQKPKRPLPYLFLYSPEQNTGKSILHEALSLLMTKGVVRAEACLDPNVPFNGELEGAILCVIEELELSKTSKVYARLKDWVTSVELGIHPKNQTPYSVINTTHWIQCANSHSASPVFPGDTRITVINVPPFKGEEIPREIMRGKLSDEAPAFLYKVLNLELPDPPGRLGVPVVNTSYRQVIMSQEVSPLQVFLQLKCKVKLGWATKGTHFISAFHEWLGDQEEINKWSNLQTYKHLPPLHMKGFATFESGYWIPNIALEHDIYVSREVCDGIKLVVNDRSILKPENESD